MLGRRAKSGCPTRRPSRGSTGSRKPPSGAICPMQRPHFKDYAAALIADFTPLAGDRNFGEDAAITGGLGRFRGRPVVVMGHEKGNDPTSRLRHNFGMAKPEGYRKAIRLMKLAEQFGLPVIPFVDTAGSFPGVAAEERRSAERR